MIKNYKIEVCAGSVDDCAIADKFDVDRIELNHALELGGLTPSIGTLLKAREVTKLPICCMVRPRTSGFVYSEKQFESMLIDAELLIKNGADGIVFGFLKKDNTIDVDRTVAMVTLIKDHGKEAIFHKAIENTADIVHSCGILVDCKIDRILTSGGLNYPSIHEGFDVINEMLAKYGDKIEILVGGGVRANNIVDIAKKTKCNQIHMTAKETLNDNGDYVAVSENVLRDILTTLDKGI